jgi:sugar lactone lactonase YvrE
VEIVLDGGVPDGICLDAEGAVFLVANEWPGAASMADEARTGQVLTARAPAPGAGWP